MKRQPRRFVHSVTRNRTVTPEVVQTHVVDMDTQRCVWSVEGAHSEDVIYDALYWLDMMEPGDTLTAAAP